MRESGSDPRTLDLQRAVREVSDEWTADGRLHLPPDDISQDDDLAFWRAVEVRMAEHALRDPPPDVQGS